MPASRHQNHTTSPSAALSFVFRHCCVHRIPRPTFCDDRETPLERGGTAVDVLLIWVRAEVEYFSQGDWTVQISLIGLRFSLFWRIVSVALELSA